MSVHEGRVRNRAGGRRRLAGLVAVATIGLGVASPAIPATAAAGPAPGPSTAPVSSVRAAAPPLPSTATTSEGPDGLWRVAAEGWPAAPRVDGASWILVDVGTGQILGGQDEDVRRPPASTTKLLTALVAVRRTSPGDVVEVGDEVLGLEGASTGLRPGDRLTIDDLLALLLLRSGNDAAVALAVHVAGSEEAFAGMLAAEAEALAIPGAEVVEPHGLFDRNRLSARDLAVIGRAVLAEERLRPLVGAVTWQLASGRVITNRNELLGEFGGATGLKTGQTQAAGWSLVASARRGQRHLVAVVLGGATAQSRFTSAAALLDHGFAGFARPPALPALRLRGDAAWVEVVAPQGEALLPVGTSPSLVPTIPVELVDPTIRWSWDTANGSGGWHAPGRLSAAAGAATVSPVTGAGTVAAEDGTDGTAALGAWLSGRIQAGMRAATVAGAWD